MCAATEVQPFPERDCVLGHRRLGGVVMVLRVVMMVALGVVMMMALGVVMMVALGVVMMVVRFAEVADNFRLQFSREGVERCSIHLRHSTGSDHVKIIPKPKPRQLILNKHRSVLGSVCSPLVCSSVSPTERMHPPARTKPA